MRFGVLGSLAVWEGEGKSVKLPEAKARALLAALLVYEGRPVSADRLIDDLWGEEPPGRPANALQAKVSLLRRTVGRDRVAYQAAGYRLRIDDEDDVDADRFRTLVLRARGTADPRARAAAFADALDLWRGPAYADFADAAFARPAAQRLEEQRLVVLEEQAEARLEAGEHGRLVAELTALVDRNPLRERLRAAQMRALYRSGRQSEALASYDELRAHLAEQLGLDPSPELADLHRSILVQAPELAAAPPATRPRGNLPTPLAGLVGREREVTELGALLTGSRLVTLTGPGGVGKTRLAVETAGRLADACPDGGWLVELAGQRGATADLVDAVAATLGIRDEGAGDPTAWGADAGTGHADRLAAALRDRHTLLVLDNCEQIVEQVADLAGRLLRAAPGLRILATSREPLGLAGETLWAVEPLRPDEATRLFTERAAAVAPGFVLDAGNTEAVAVICRRLDGIPLALELAATRVRALGVHELAERLDDRFRVLAGGRRDSPARQRTLRAVIDWSWELLSAPERIVLRRLAAHTDGCTLRAAEVVCAGDGVSAEDIPDLLIRLVDRSLVVMTEDAAGPRYRLLESVAAYGVERLYEMVDFEPVHERHLDYYTELAERAEPHLRGSEQRAWLLRVDAEAANLRVALDTAVRQGAADRALRLVTALSWYWVLRGRLGEARRAVAAALSADGPAPADARAEVHFLQGSFALLGGERRSPGPDPDIDDPARRARARRFRAYALFNTGDLAASEALTAAALADFLALDDRWGIAAALGQRAIHDLIRGDMAALRRDSARSAELFAELGDRWGRSRTSVPLAALAEIDGDYAEAARVLRDGLRVAEELGLAAEVSSRLSGLGRIALLTGDWDRARELHERARRSAAEQSLKFGEIHAEIGLGLGARRQGDLDTAHMWLSRVRDWYGRVSSEAGNSLVLAELGFIAEQRGDADTARALHLEGLAIARLVGDPRAVALAFEGLSGVEALAARPERAARLLGAATAARAGAHAPLPPAERGDVDRITAAARAALGKAAFDAAFRAGTEADPAEALGWYA